ncbi:hypothetical protein B0H19DRAFT_1077119 [Mycena capillaripes]|nr:hypothetical protein B0H19DRAFT_1077119 [Mycena capillaripes]
MVWHAVTPPPDNPSRDDIIWLAGPRLIGLIFNWALLGVLTTQVYIYHVNFPKDRRVLKAIGKLLAISYWTIYTHNSAVYIVYVLDWIQTCSATYDGFQWFVYGWGDIPTLYGVFTDFLNVPILSSTIGSIVQIFFGWRIWALSQSWITFAAIVLLSCLQLGAGGAAAYYLYQNASEVSRSAGLVLAVGIRLGSSAVVDTIIAGSMTYFLVQSRGEALSRMQTVLTRLIRLTIETGTLTAIAAIMDLLFFLKAHNALHQISGPIRKVRMYNHLPFTIRRVPTHGQRKAGIRDPLSISAWSKLNRTETKMCKDSQFRAVAVVGFRSGAPFLAKFNL